MDYNLLQPQTVDPIPIPEVMEAWRADYNKMIEEMFYEENPPTFDQIVSELTQLKNRINAMPWKIEIQFPIHKP